VSWRLRECVYNKGVEDQLGREIGQIVYTVGEKPSIMFEYVRKVAVEVLLYYTTSWLYS
jgi:hypothetical protein